jgi:hypothetical protein
MNVVAYIADADWHHPACLEEAYADRDIDIHAEGETDREGNEFYPVPSWESQPYTCGTCRGEGPGWSH